MRLKAIAADRCDAAGCGSDWDLRLLAGASLLNPGKDVRLCQAHWAAWLTEESEMRARLVVVRQQEHNPHHQIKPLIPNALNSAER